MRCSIFSTKLILGTWLLACAGVTLAASGTLYRYKDEQGNVVLNSTIPSEVVAKGYEVLNAQGRVIEKVPPALTKEQRAQRDAEKLRKEAEEEARKQQEIQDKELKLLYSHPDDIVRILQRRIQDAQAVIQLRRSQIEISKKQIAQLESTAADAQRKGKDIPDQVLDSLSQLRKGIGNDEADIEEQKQEMQRAIQEFDAKIRRMEVLTGQRATDYDKLLGNSTQSPQELVGPPRPHAEKAAPQN